MSVFVKICGLSDQQHVESAVEAGANALGFVFAESARKVTPGQARTISESVPQHVKRVAVMLHPANDEWLEVLKIFEPDVLQTDSGDFEALDVPYTVERWPVFREGGPRPNSDGTFVFEGPKSGKGETVDWSAAAGLAANGDMILAGGLGVNNVVRAITTVRPWGVDVSSGVETSPGKKDSALIEQFISAVRAAEKTL
ncbi:MAG: phosphoribosylanthranilate isomerase [Gammaproteobacteria bacterium]